MSAARQLPDSLPPLVMPGKSHRLDMKEVMKSRVERFFADNGERVDANETIAVARSLLYVASAPVWKSYVAPIWRSLFPVDPTLPDWAESHSYVEIDQIGDAEIVDDYADDSPRVDVKGSETLGKVVPIRVSYGYSIQDLRKSARLMVPLDTAKALTARDVYERKLERLVAFGDTPHNILGITNAANKLHATDIGTAWATASSAQMQTDMARIINVIPDTTNGIHETNLVLFPQAAWSIIRTKRLDDFNQTTILEYLRKVYPEITFAKWTRLNLANAGGTAGRIMAFDRKPQNAKVMIAIDFLQHPPIQKGLMFNVECEGRFGGWQIPKPSSVAYMDGVN